MYPEARLPTTAVHVHGPAYSRQRSSLRRRDRAGDSCAEYAADDVNRSTSLGVVQPVKAGVAWTALAAAGGAVVVVAGTVVVVGTAQAASSAGGARKEPWAPSLPP